MARLKLAPSAYPEGLSESRLPTLQAPKILSRLELMRNDFQERNLRAKEEKILSLLNQQQERIVHRVTGPSLHTQNKPYSGPWGPEEKAWASNWTVSKKTAGIDRAHPLKPVFHHKATNPGTGNYHPPSANATRYKSSPPVQEQLLRSKSGPARTDPWQHLERKEFNLEAEIRRKEALLREKLRKTEEELRRIQREKEEAEIQDQRVPEVQNTRQGRGATTQNRATKTFHEPGYGEEDEVGYHPRGGNYYPQEERSHPGPQKFHPGGDRFHPRENRSYSGRDQFHPGAHRPHQDPETNVQINAPTSVRKTKHIEQADIMTAAPTKGPSPITGAPEDPYTNRSSIAGPIEDNGEDLVPCGLCGRNFMAKRLEKHTQVCQKMANSKRKVFDSSKARAKGTDLEQFLHTQGRPKDPPPQVKRSTWRQKHESFMRTIRQARMVQNVVSRGGKLSDLPPPPPEENPDYVTCPHCNRRFAPAAAERHIPKCETIKSKPRPPPARRR